MIIDYHCTEDERDKVSVFDDGVGAYLELFITDPERDNRVRLDRTGLVALRAQLDDILGRLRTPPAVP